ncbi:MAG: hypothetical protein V4629_11395 [Pseudomonadota bacterium]
MIISLIFMALIGVLSTITLLSGNATVRATGDWVDRQKTLNIADSALKIAQNTIEDKLAKVDMDNSIEAEMDAPEISFYLREDGSVPPPEWDPWPPNSVNVNLVQNDASYFVIYEGSTQLLNPGDSFDINKNSYAHWFTIYARANGERKDTQVILSLFKDFAL